MTAYKGTSNLKCQHIKFEVGETYEIDGELIMCEKGFHFCENLIDVHGFYSFENINTVILEIEVLGNVIKEDVKSVTNKMRVLRIVPKTEYHKIVPENFDKKGNLIYWKNSNGNWWKKKYDNNNNCIYYEDSGFWWKSEYDKNNNKIYEEFSDGFWCKYEYDNKNNRISYENSDGFKINYK